MLATTTRRWITCLGVLIFLQGCQSNRLAQRLISDSPSEREAALEKLYELPSKKRAKLVAPLIKALKNSDNRRANRAAEALAAVGEASIPALKETLKDPNVFVRLSAVSAFGMMGAAATPALKELGEALRDPHPLVREEVAVAIGRIGPAAASAAPDLFVALKDENPEVRSSAAIALEKLGVKRS